VSKEQYSTFGKRDFIFHNFNIQCLTNDKSETEKYVMFTSAFTD